MSISTPNQEQLQNKTVIIDGITLVAKLPDQLIKFSNEIRRYGWIIQVAEIQREDEDGSFRGHISIGYHKQDLAKSNEAVNELFNIFTLDSMNTFSRSQLENDNPNIVHTDRYVYEVDMQTLGKSVAEAVQKIKYSEAGGNPEAAVWPISPEQLREHYPRYFWPKILIDGWSKSLDDSKLGKSTELTSEEVERVEQVTAIIGSRLIKAIHDNSQPPVVTAGNSAGVQKLISSMLEPAGATLLFALPEAKDPEKYILPSRTFVLQAPAQTGQLSQWGDELIGETGIASTEFDVRDVILIGGGENLKRQIPMYLDNVLTARNKSEMYVIAAVQGVGGASSKEVLLEELKKYSKDEKYASLFTTNLERGYLPNWLILLDSEDLTHLSSEVDDLITHTYFSDNV